MGGTVKKGLNSCTSAPDLQPSEGTELPIVPFLCAEQENDDDLNEPTQNNGSFVLKQEHTCTGARVCPLQHTLTSLSQTHHNSAQNTLAEDSPAINFGTILLLFPRLDSFIHSFKCFIGIFEVLNPRSRRKPPFRHRPVDSCPSDHFRALARSFLSLSASLNAAHL